MMWVNVGLIFSIILIFPVYRHIHQTHQLVQTAKSTGVWAQIPRYVPAQAEYIDVLHRQAKSLLLKLKIQDATITIQAEDLLPIYTFLHRMIQMPALQIESFTMKKEKAKVVAIIAIVIPKGRGVGYLSSQTIPHIQNSFYSSRFFYVNAATEVDGQKQIWVNGKNYGPSCPWPLYHTFDKQTGTVKKGDLRPRLSLTSGT